MLMWAWLGYMNPHRLTWHFAHEMPYAIWLAVATLVILYEGSEADPLGP